MMKPVPFRLTTLAGLLGLGAIAGCVSTMPHWDAHQGDSVRVLGAAQHWIRRPLPRTAAVREASTARPRSNQRTGT